MALLVSILCQHHHKMRYHNRMYMCDGSEHGTWRCEPTYRKVDDKITKLGEGTPLPGQRRVR